MAVTTLPVHHIVANNMSTGKQVYSKHPFVSNSPSDTQHVTKQAAPWRYKCMIDGLELGAQNCSLSV